MAMATFSVAAPGKCCCSATVSTPQSSSSFSAAGTQNVTCSHSFHLGNNKHRSVLQLNAYGPSRSPPRPLLPRCNSVSDDEGPASSTSPPLPSAPAPSVPEVTGEPEATAEIGKEMQQQLRPRTSTRREASSTDPVSSSLSRRFGLAGGLAWAGFLAFGVISEQIKTRTEVARESEATQDVQNAKEIVLDNDVKYVDLRVGGGSSPIKGDLVLVDVTGKVRSSGEVFVDTPSAKRPLAFVYGLKPYPRAVCYGLEFALQSMKAGGKRKVMVPADQCFGEKGEDFGNAVVVPGGAEIEYEVELQRVSIAPS